MAESTSLDVFKLYLFPVESTAFYASLGMDDYVFLKVRACPMTAAEFRRIALSMPEAIESAHMEHPDFRVGGKIFATLGYPDEDHGMVILPPEEQERLVRSDSAAFTPAKGAWGLRGSTCVRLDAVDASALQRAMEIAWRKRAPKGLLRKRAANSRSLGSARASRADAGALAGMNFSPGWEARFGEGAKTSTRGACAPQTTTPARRRSSSRRPPCSRSNDRR